MAAKRGSPRKIKIAIFHCGFIYSGGGERIVLEEARGLTERGYDVGVYAPTVDYNKCFPEFTRTLGIKMFLPSFFDQLPYRNALRMLVSSILAPFLTFKFRDTDVFIGANQPGAWIAFCMAKVLKKPYLVYLNQPNRIVYPRPVDIEYGWNTTVSDYHFLYRFFQYLKPVLLWLDRVSIRQAGSIMVNGSYIGDIIANVYSHAVVDNPAGAYVYPRESRLNNTSQKNNYILITNRHDPQKRFDYCIKAFALIEKKVKNVKLVIPGPFTHHTKKLINLVKKLNIVHKVNFTGKISESMLQKLYKDALIYCYPSPEEDFGLGPLEAGGWGVPTVAWNHGGPTVTVKDGESGFLVEPYNIQDYADKLLILLRDGKLREKMGKNAYLRTRDVFSWKNHIDIIEKEIFKVIKNKIN